MDGPGEDAEIEVGSVIEAWCFVSSCTCEIMVDQMSQASRTEYISGRHISLLVIVHVH